MQARVLRFTINSDNFDDAREIIEGGVVPALRAQPGFVRGAMLFDRPTGDAFTVVIWESAEELRAWEESAAMKAQLGRIMPVLNGAPQTEIYDIGYRIPIEGAPTAGRTIETRIKLRASDAAVKAYSEVVEDSLKDQPGFSAALLLIDTQSGAGISITAWDNEAAMRANEASGAVRSNLARFGEHLEGTPRTRSWELRPLR